MTQASHRRPPTAATLDGPSHVPAIARGIGYLRLYRISVAAPISAAFLLGLEDADAHKLSPLLWLWLLGILYHAYGCGLNDLADAEIDQRNPARKVSPLPGRILTVPEALFATNICGIGFLIVPWLARLPVRTFPLCAALAVLVTWGNIFQKRSRWIPALLIDWLFIPAAGGPVVIGAMAADRHADFIYGIALAFGVQMVLFNVAAGNLKDLRYDVAAGSRTTAVALGVTNDSSGLRLTDSYRRYVIALQLVVMAVLLWSLPRVALPWPIACDILATLFSVAALCDLLRMLRTNSPASNGRQLAIILNWMALIILVATREPLIAGIATLFTIVWVLIFRWLESRPVSLSRA